MSDEHNEAKYLQWVRTYCHHANKVVSVDVARFLLSRLDAAEEKANQLASKGGDLRMKNARLEELYGRYVQEEMHLDARIGALIDKLADSEAKAEALQWMEAQIRKSETFYVLIGLEDDGEMAVGVVPLSPEGLPTKGHKGSTLLAAIQQAQKEQR